MPEEQRAAVDQAVEVKHGDRTIRIDARPVTTPPPAQWPVWIEWPSIGLLAAVLWFSQPYIHTALFVALIFACVLGGLALLVLIRMLVPPNFDLVKGELSYGWPGFRKRRRFADLAAIQLVTDDREKYRFELGKNPSARKLSATHQVNLYFADDAEEPRFVLSSFENTHDAKAFGRRLADMLKAPLVDQIAEEKAPLEKQGPNDESPPAVQDT